MVSARGEAHVTPLRAGCARYPGAGRHAWREPGVPGCYPGGHSRRRPPITCACACATSCPAGVRTAIEDDAVAGTANTLVHRYSVRQAGHLLEQAAASCGDRRDVGIMFFWYHQHMCGCLRIDIPERDSP